MTISKETIKIALIVVVALILGFVVGKFIFDKNSNQSGTPSPIATTSPQVSASITPTQSISPLASTTICAENLKKQTQDTGTQYQPGTLIVSFKKTISFEQAGKILKNSYDATIEDPTDMQKTFSSNHLVTADISSGQEFMTLCSMQSDSNIQHASLNTIFSLHE